MTTRIFGLLFMVVSFFCYSGSHAQTTDKDDSVDYNNGDLEKILDHNPAGHSRPSGYYVSATFKSTRVIDGHSIENTGKGVLDFRIAHRFGQLNEGVKNLYGLDNATTKFSFDYGIRDWLMVGIGRSSFDKEYEGFLKCKVLRQTIDDRMPVSVGFLAGTSVRTLDVVNILGYTYSFSNRLYYVSQVFVARKFNNWLSVQLMPSYIHFNLVNNAGDPNDLLAAGIAARLKVSKRMAITWEYYYNIPGYKLSGYNNPVSLGIDIETGGHVFQLFLTNSAYTSERTFIAETNGDITKGAIHLGFNISRVFTLVHPRQAE